MAKQTKPPIADRAKQAKSEKCEDDAYWEKYPAAPPPPRDITSHPYIRRMPADERAAFAAAIQGLEAKLDHIRDTVRGVVKTFHTGLFLHGEGGTSKSYTVLKELQALRAKYVLHNTRLTGRGLVDALKRAPTDIHVIEDAETLLDDKKSFGVLRSALWS